MRLIIGLSSVALAIAVIAAPASAQSGAAPAAPLSHDQQLERCANEARQYTPAEEIAGCTGLIEADPQNEAAYINRGLVYGRDLHDYDRAIAEFNQAIALAPQDAEPYHNRGMAYKGLGQMDRANADFDKAEELDPDRYGD